MLDSAAVALVGAGLQRKESDLIRMFKVAVDSRRDRRNTEGGCHHETLGGIGDSCGS